MLIHQQKDYTASHIQIYIFTVSSRFGCFFPAVLMESLSSKPSILDLKKKNTTLQNPLLIFFPRILKYNKWLPGSKIFVKMVWKTEMTDISWACCMLLEGPVLFCPAWTHECYHIKLTILILNTLLFDLQWQRIYIIFHSEQVMK